jgi:hypothetical protein
MGKVGERESHQSEKEKKKKEEKGKATILIRSLLRTRAHAIIPSRRCRSTWMVG